MSYSHRDRRAHRDVRRDFEIVLGATVALGVVILFVTWPFVWIAALLALAALGAVSMARADRLIRIYARDLEGVRTGKGGSGVLRAEVSSDVGLDRSVVRPSAVSPHRRRGPVAQDREAPDVPPSREP